MVLLSGHTETDQLGRGGFQELKQVEMAAPVCKASWMATDTRTVGMELAKAIRIATSGRPGPVHLSLPSDILDPSVPEDSIPWPTEADFAATPVGLSNAAADTILSLIAGAKRPLIIGAPVLANRPGRDLLARIEAALGVPTVISEGPRSFNDATLGRYAEVAKDADLVVLLGKALDFTLKFGEAPFFDTACQFISIDPEGALIDRATKAKGAALIFGCVADTYPAGEALIARAKTQGDAAWLASSRAAFAQSLLRGVDVGCHVLRGVAGEGGRALRESAA